MQGYEEDLDEEAGYEDYYSDDDVEQEYEEEEEDERPPSKDEMEYLELRQQLKDSYRKKKGSANAQSSQDRRRKLPYNDFGSFFGPSRPVISSRVIQESKSLLENEIRTARTPTSSNQIKKKPVPTSNSGAKNVSNEKQRPKVVNEVRRKVQALKDTRDYSFLLSDDAELPVPKKEPLSRSSSFPNSGFLLMFKRLVLLNHQRDLNNHQVSSMVELLLAWRRDPFQRMGTQDRLPLAAK